MSDKFRNTFQDKRSDFDVAKAPTDLWASIEQELDQKLPQRKESKVVKGVFGMKNILRFAAMFIMTFGLGYWVANQQNIQTNDSALASHFNLKDISPEVAEAEIFYFSSISDYKNEIKEYDQNYPELVKEFLGEHEQMDSMYLELKNTLQQDLDNGQILELMIQNLQMRMTVLEHQKSILENINNQKNEDNGNVRL